MSDTKDNPFAPGTLRHLRALIPPGSERGRLLHDYAIEPFALGIGRFGFTVESRELYDWSKARHRPERDARGAKPSFLNRIASACDRLVAEADASDHARRERGGHG